MTNAVQVLKIDQAMQEIEAIVRKNDLAAHVILVDDLGETRPGLYITPSWGCVHKEDGSLRVQLSDEGIKALIETDSSGLYRTHRVFEKLRNQLAKSLEFAIKAVNRIEIVMHNLP